MKITECKHFLFQTPKSVTRVNSFFVLGNGGRCIKQLIKDHKMDEWQHCDLNSNGLNLEVIF